MSKYIVWLDYYTEGWKPSEELDTLDDCFKWLIKNNYGSRYQITKKVDVAFIEQENQPNE